VRHGHRGRPRRSREGARGARPVKVLVVTNMYPTPQEPWFGSFVRDQVEDLQKLAVDVEVLAFDGRNDAIEYGRAARRIRRSVRTGRFDLPAADFRPWRPAPRSAGA